MDSGNRYIAYRLVILGLILFSVAAGITLCVVFLKSTIMPAPFTGGRILSTNYWGSYLAAVAGCLFFTWACFLGWSFRYPVQGRFAGAASVVGLLLAALLNLAARFSGEYGEAAEWQRLTTVAALSLALALTWLTPAKPTDQEEQR